MQLRDGLVAQVGGTMALEVETLSPAQTYTLFGRMDTEMAGFVSAEGFEQHALAQVGGRLADIAEMMIDDSEGQKVSSAKTALMTRFL